MGAYEHLLYTLADGIATPGDLPRPDDLQLEFAEYRKQGTSYFLKENLYHAIGAEPGTATLIVRGPATRDHFTVMDKGQGRSWVQTAQIHEPVTERNRKRMTDAQYQDAVQQLEKLGVITPW
ncbi:hypothetical protein D3C79_682890 [compost metagenome]